MIMEPYRTNKEIISAKAPYDSDYLKKPPAVIHPEDITKVKGNYIKNLPREIKVPLSNEEKKEILNQFQTPLVSDKAIDPEILTELYENLEEFELEI